MATKQIMGFQNFSMTVWCTLVHGDFFINGVLPVALPAGHPPEVYQDPLSPQLSGWTPGVQILWHMPWKHPGWRGEQKVWWQHFSVSTYFQGDKACLLLWSVWVYFHCLAGLELLQDHESVTGLVCTLANKCIVNVMQGIVNTEQLKMETIRTRTKKWLHKPNSYVPLLWVWWFYQYTVCVFLKYL